MVFQFRDGFSCGKPAQMIGPWLEEIKERNAGRLRPRDVVEAARPDDSVAHACFEWNDSVAGEKWRQEQARKIIRHVVVVENQDDIEEDPRTTPAYVSIARPRLDGQGYMGTHEALSSADTREIVISLALASLRGWRRRYGHLEELAHVVAAIEEVEVAAAG